MHNDAFLYIQRMHIIRQTTPCAPSSLHLARPGAHAISWLLLCYSYQAGSMHQASIYGSILCIKHQYSGHRHRLASLELSAVRKASMLFNTVFRALLWHNNMAQCCASINLWPDIVHHDQASQYGSNLSIIYQQD